MSAAYWSQWSHAEIMSMHGVELDYEDIDLENQQQQEEEEEGKKHCCRDCMDCLGLSWKDFM